MNQTESKHLRVFQAFRYALDLTPEQWRLFNRECGARRVAFNWAVRTIRNQMVDGVLKQVPTLSAMLNLWRKARTDVCKDRDGQEWWPEVSADSFIDGVRSGIDGVRRWHLSAHGRIPGKKLNFPHERRRSSRTDSCTYLNVSIPLTGDRRHVDLPVLGRCRTHENIRKLQRQVANGSLEIFAVTLRRRGKYVHAAYRVRSIRPQRPAVRYPRAVVGVDVGVRWLATIATADGRIIGRLANPQPLMGVLAELRLAHRQLARRVPGSNAHKEAQAAIRMLNAKASQQRSDLFHKLSRYLAGRYGTIVIEKLTVDDMRSRARKNSSKWLRRALADASLAELGRLLSYKCTWYGSKLIVADKYMPSSKLCSNCGMLNEPGPAEMWTCGSCRKEHHRDENAAVNLARLGLKRSSGRKEA